MIGTSFQHYRIVERIGAGGMGEVYRATDTRLGRDVAIKILPSSVSRDGDRMARFQREARTLAALNHPNIAAIYGLEEAGALRFLVLEFVPGNTLTGPLPVEEVLTLLLQVAEALEA
ncbi:MAG: serine/threonine-protein kinase, partial [Candidatus Acidiferrales bacterium]